MPFIWAFLGSFFLCIAANVISQAVDIGAFLNNDTVFWILFSVLAIAAAKMALGGTFLHERKPAGKTRAQHMAELDAMLEDNSTAGCYYSNQYGYFDDEDNANYISAMAPHSHRSSWVGGWNETVQDMHGNTIVTHNSDGTGLFDE